MSNVWISHVTHTNGSCHRCSSTRSCNITNESCHTYERVMSHIWIRHFTHMDEPFHWCPSPSPCNTTNESCQTYEWVMSRVLLAIMTQHYKTRSSCDTYKHVMSHIRISHVTHMNESCRPYEWIPVSHVTDAHRHHHATLRMRHVTYTYESKWVMSQIPFAIIMQHYDSVSQYHVTHMNESCHTYERVMSHIWMIDFIGVPCHHHTTLRMSHVTHMNESCHTYEYVMSHIWMRHVAHTYESKWVMSQVPFAIIMQHYEAQSPHIFNFHPRSCVLPSAQNCAHFFRNGPAILKPDDGTQGNVTYLYICVWVNIYDCMRTYLYVYLCMCVCIYL